MAANEFLKFKVGDFYGALPLARVREVLPMVHLVRPPLRASVLEGYVELAGHAVPVLRLDRALGLDERAPAEADHLILLRGSESPVALHVERVLGIGAVADGDWLAGDAGTFGPAISGGFRHGDVVVHVLDLERFSGGGADAVAAGNVVRWRGDAA